MEKRLPHYSLTRIKELVRMGAYHVTRTAMRCADRDFGFGEPREVAGIVLLLGGRDFYKSMTSRDNPRLWQDVYHGQVEGLDVYIKLQVDKEETVVISFKLLEQD